MLTHNHLCKPIILDTGATHHFYNMPAPTTTAPHLRNITPTSDGIEVLLPNSTKIKSTHQANINLPSLPTSATSVHLFPSLASGSLLSIGQLCDSGCSATFTKTDASYGAIDILPHPYGTSIPPLQPFQLRFLPLMLRLVHPAQQCVCVSITPPCFHRHLQPFLPPFVQVFSVPFLASTSMPSVVILRYLKQQLKVISLQSAAICAPQLKPIKHLNTSTTYQLLHPRPNMSMSNAMRPPAKSFQIKPAPFLSPLLVVIVMYLSSTTMIATTSSLYLSQAAPRNN